MAINQEQQSDVQKYNQYLLDGGTDSLRVWREKTEVKEEDHGAALTDEQKAAFQAGHNPNGGTLNRNPSDPKELITGRTGLLPEVSEPVIKLPHAGVGHAENVRFEGSFIGDSVFLRPPRKQHQTPYKLRLKKEDNPDGDYVELHNSETEDADITLCRYEIERANVPVWGIPASVLLDKIHLAGFDKTPDNVISFYWPEPPPHEGAVFVDERRNDFKDVAEKLKQNLTGLRYIAATDSFEVGDPESGERVDIGRGISLYLENGHTVVGLSIDSITAHLDRRKIDVRGLEFEG